MYHDVCGTLNGRQLEDGSLLYGCTCNMSLSITALHGLAFDTSFPSAAFEVRARAYKALKDSDFGFAGEHQARMTCRLEQLCCTHVCRALASSVPQSSADRCSRGQRCKERMRVWHRLPRGPPDRGNLGLGAKAGFYCPRPKQRCWCLLGRTWSSACALASTTCA